MTTTNDSTPSPTRFMFVYGSLRPAYRELPTTVRRLEPPRVLQHGTGRWHSSAVLRGYALYDIGCYPGVVRFATDSTDAAAAADITGDLFAVSDDDLPVLDDYEGVGPGHDAPCEYERVARDVVLPDGSVISAWVYEYTWSIAGKTRIDHGDYVRHCKVQLEAGMKNNEDLGERAGQFGAREEGK